MISLQEVDSPREEPLAGPVELTDETMLARKKNVLHQMEREDLDALVIYADLEHGSNWEYLTGFLPRFEEALLILHADGIAYLVLGNENLNKASKSRIKAQAIHLPHFSLPNQPMLPERTVKDTLSLTGIQDAEKIGVVGWKNFTSACENNKLLFDLPSFLMEALREICPNSKFINMTRLFIGEGGVRTINNANEFAHYEFGATLAGNAMLSAMDALEVGVTEFELGDLLNRWGQRNSVVTIAAAGERFVKANMYPTSRAVHVGDTISLTVGYKGGLESRAGYAVHDTNELPERAKDYLARVAIPYQETVKRWLECIHCGMAGGELYNVVENTLPKSRYGWKLNPGHLCADEEWLSSPVYPDSSETMQSGMLFQIDIIPSVPGYGGVSCESGIFLADKQLQSEIADQYPEIWARIKSRRTYLKNCLGIDVAPEVLPTSSATAFLRPYLLDKRRALVGC
jgi:Xaa-Pro aminopeptidase